MPCAYIISFFSAEKRKLNIVKKLLNMSVEILDSVVVSEFKKTCIIIEIVSIQIHLEIDPKNASIWT